MPNQGVNQFLWILPSRADLPTHEGCPAEFMIPKHWLHVSPASIFGKPVWIVEKDAGGALLLWGCVTVSQTFRILEALNKDDLILRADLRRSFRVGGNLPIRTPILGLTADVGLFECPIDVHSEATSLLASQTPIHIRPSQVDCPLVATKYSKWSIQYRASRILSYFSSQYSLFDLGRWGKVGNLSPRRGGALGP